MKEFLEIAKKNIKIDIQEKINEYRKTNDEKIIHEIYNNDIKFYISEAIKRSNYVDFDTSMSIIYQAVRHSVIKYNGNSNFLSYTRLWISDYFFKHKQECSLVKVPNYCKENHFYINELPLLIEKENECISLKCLNEKEKEIIEQYYIIENKPKKICKDLNITLKDFFTIKKQALVKLRNNNI